jgi:hypothetical protein
MFRAWLSLGEFLKLLRSSLFSTKLIACCIFSFCATFGLFKTLTLGGDLNSDLGDFILGILVAKVYYLSPPSDFSFSSTSLSLPTYPYPYPCHVPFAILVQLRPY